MASMKDSFQKGSVEIVSAARKASFKEARTPFNISAELAKRIKN